MARMFPNNRTDLMNGEWQVFLETFTGNFQAHQKREKEPR